jgi:uncharacterized protein YndB with AHSA1/START domain
MSEPEPTPPTPDRRTIDLEVEVPGTPEEVWAAIATSPGISAWFVPAEVDPHEGGKLSLDFGAMGEDSSVVTAWDPPRRWATTWPEWGSEQGSALELLVEARAGGTCVVRLVHSAFGAGAEWDDELDQTTRGWAAFLQNLRIYLVRFAPQPCSSIFVYGTAGTTATAAWTALTGGLGLPDLAEGQRVATSPEAGVGAGVGAEAAGVPRLAGVVEQVAVGSATLVLDEPAAGYAVLAADGPDGRVFMNLSAYLFGDGAATIAEQATPIWQAWMERHFPLAKG